MAFLGFIITVIAQILNGTVSVLDKFLLKKTLQPPVFAFWISLTGISALLLLFFDFAVPYTSKMWLIDLVAGATFSLAVLFMYIALEKEEVSRVVPIIGSLIPVFTLLASFFYLKQSLNQPQLIAIIVLIFGIILLTYRKSFKPVNYVILASAPLAALLFAISSVLMKEIFTQQPFISGLAWSRLGGLIILPIVLLHRPSRNEIFNQKETPKKGNIVVFWLGRVLSGAGFIMINLSYALLNPTIVNALQGVQYAYLFVATILLGKFWPQLFNESWDKKLIAFKIGGLVSIIAGSVILSLYP